MDSIEQPRHPAEPEMILVQSGSLLTDDSETPTAIADFQIGKYPVTQLQWKSVMHDNPSFFQADDHPVEMVSWDEAQEFIKYLNALTGKNYRLPASDEWEYAARGGSDGGEFEYSGSDNIDDVAWHEGNSDGGAHPVGMKQPNGLGICDMSGNVWEWCDDWLDDSQTMKIFRGGSWKTAAVDCQVAFLEEGYHPDDGLNDVGFRLALTV